MRREAKIPTAMLSFLLLSNARLDGSQRESILVSVSSNLIISDVACSELQSSSAVITNN